MTSSASGRDGGIELPVADVRHPAFRRRRPICTGRTPPNVVCRSHFVRCSQARVGRLVLRMTETARSALRDPSWACRRSTCVMSLPTVGTHPIVCGSERVGVAVQLCQALMMGPAPGHGHQDQFRGHPGERNGKGMDSLQVRPNSNGIARLAPSSAGLGTVSDGEWPDSPGQR